MALEITWDDRKRLSNFDKHGYDFDDLDEDFFEAAMVVASKKVDGRFLAIGPFDGRVVTVVFRPLGIEGIPIISMRPARADERRFFDAV
jgi:uncharacterized DUF497 family protein